MENQELIYDDEQAVVFILDYLKKNSKCKIKRDDVEYLMDILYDFYESTGAIIEDDEEVPAGKEEVSFDHEDMFQFVKDTLEEEENSDRFSDEDIEAVLAAEMAYCESIGIVSDED
jgi:glutamyl/glutaminyl-tRNA synthetase